MPMNDSYEDNSFDWESVFVMFITIVPRNAPINDIISNLLTFSFIIQKPHAATNNGCIFLINSTFEAGKYLIAEKTDDI